MLIVHDMDTETLIREPGMTGTRFSQEQLDGVLAQHALWLESEGKEGRRANLRDADLTGCSLAARNFVQVSLRGADLRGVEMNGAVFDEADFTDARISDVIASGVSFRRANMTHVKAERGMFSESDFSFTNLTQTVFTQASFARSNLSESVLRGAIMEQCDFTDANLFGATLREASFKSCTLNDVMMDESDCREAQFKSMRFVRVSVVEAQFRNAEFTDVQFIETDILSAHDFDPKVKAQELEHQAQKIETTRVEFEQTVQQVTEKHTTLDKWAQELTGEKDREKMVQEMLVKNASRLKYFSVLWGLVVMLTGALAAVMIATIKYKSLHTLEIAIVFGVMGAIELLFLSSLFILQQTARRLEQHIALRERKLVSWHNETMPMSAGIAETTTHAAVTPSATNATEAMTRV